MRWSLLLLLFSSTFSLAAGEAPQSLTLDGRLYNSASGTDPLLDPSITLTIDILNPNKDCILYQERQTISTSGSNGAFNIQVGSPTAGGTSANRTGSDSLNAMATVFQNSTAIPGKLVSTNASCTYTPANGDVRYIRVHVSPSTGVASVLNPDLTVDSVPTALVAESLHGVVSSNILQADATTSLSQSNLATVFSNSNYPKLTSLLSGGSSQYVSSGSGVGASLPSYSTASPPSTPAAGSIWYDSTAQVVKLFDGSTTQTLGVSGGSTPTGGAGGDLGGSYPNPSVATVGTSTASNIHAAELLANSATNLNTSSMIVKRDSSGNFSATQASLSSMVLRDTGSNTLTVQSPAAYTSSYAITLPVAAPTVSGQVLAATTGGVASWYTLPAALPPNGSASGDLSGSYPSPAVAKIQGNAVSATTPTATGQVYKYTTGSPGSFAPGFMGVADIRSTVTGNAQFFPTNCTAGQTFVWSSPADAMVCTDISVSASNFATQTANLVFAGPASGGAAAASFRSLASADLPKTGADGAYVNGGNSFGQAAVLGTNDSNVLSFETNNTTRMTVNTSGDVGIGTTSPIAKFHVQDGDIAVSGSTAPYIQILKTGTNASSIALSPTQISHSPVIDSGNTTAGLSLLGIKIDPYSGSAVAVSGIEGFSFVPYTEGAGTTATVKGYDAAPYFDGPVTSFTGYHVEMYTTAAVGTAIGLHVADMDRSGGTTLTNRYGIKIDSPAHSASTADFGIYQEGSSQKNYFAGNVGIGTTSPSQALDVNGNVRSTAFISTSDRRLKTNIRPIDGLALINRLHGVRYQWKKDGVEDFGLIAQEVEDVLPEAVVTDAISGYKAVKYSNLVSPLIESTKELYGMCKTMDDEIGQLAAENIQLKKQLFDVQQQNAQLDQRLRAIEARLGLK